MKFSPHIVPILYPKTNIFSPLKDMATGNLTTLFFPESQYHEVTGLPEYGGEEGGEEKPPAHLSLSYDESLESGYSTPNTRSQRVIREIIV